MTFDIVYYNRLNSNFHTHTCFCDGHDSPEELVLYALSKGCPAIGFSGHSYTDIEDEDPFCMTLENTQKYKNEVLRLKEKYKNKINIFLGVEQDYFSEEKTDDYDYVIGSVHYILKKGRYISVDGSKAGQINAVKEHYNGDFYAFIEDYYALVGDLYNKTHCDIVGHFDLITKFNEPDNSFLLKNPHIFDTGHPRYVQAADAVITYPAHSPEAPYSNHVLFDTGNPRYVQAADAALEKLLQENVIFEINYGAVSRGYKSLPYPESRMIRAIQKAGKTLICSSDCHEKENLLFGM